MSRQPTVTTRRTFLQRAAATSAAILAAPAIGRTGLAAADRVPLANIGVGGKGWTDMIETSAGGDVVAICDVDRDRLDKAAERFPKAKKFTDWRKLLEHKGIDAVTVSTPDHMHAPISLAAMELGLHVYAQKPLTHSVHESREMARLAEQKNVVTQMGIQHHASTRIKNAVHLVQNGAIGKVSEVHTWTDRPGTFWKQGLDRPKQGQTAPANLAWDLWLGVAPQRPYVPQFYHPFHWRGWWAFGTGALGDMGCHILDPVFTALQLGAPSQVRAEGPEPHPESGPLWCVIHYTFPGTKFTTDQVRVVWYEAGKQPPRAIFKAPSNWKGSTNGVLFIGEKGNAFVGFPEPAELFPREKFADYKLPEMPANNHYRQWTSAIIGQEKAACPFAYSGSLTEAVLLGNVAFRSGETIRWNAKKLTAQGVPKAEQFVKREYRTGW